MREKIIDFLITKGAYIIKQDINLLILGSDLPIELHNKYSSKWIFINV